MSETFDNVWDALFDDPAEIAVCKAKGKLMDKIQSYIEQNNFTQAEAAKAMGVSQPRISDIKRGKVSKFTIDALVEVLARVDVSVNIVIDGEQKIAQEQVDWSAFATPLQEHSYADGYEVQNVASARAIGNREMSYGRELAA